MIEMSRGKKRKKKDDKRLTGRAETFVPPRSDAEGRVKILHDRSRRFRG